jgi:thiol-disulfide isomerase/thioredoxin
MSAPRSAAALLLMATLVSRGTAQEQRVRVPLVYHAPVAGEPRPNFSPKGTQVVLTAVAPGEGIPAEAVQPVRRGIMEVGPDSSAWMPVLVSASTEHPADLTQLWLDRNRNGRFDDDGPALRAVPTQNAKTRAWWTSISNVEFTIPYATLGTTQPYFVNFWMVREDSAAVPSILRFSRGAWRSGSVTVQGVSALVAAMDADNNAVFDAEDTWGALESAAPKATQAVLSSNETRPTNRLMFLRRDSTELVLEFRRFAPDGSSIEFAVLDVPVTKASDRAPDDQLREERPRPRTTTPVDWAHGSPGLESVLADAKRTGKRILLDFEATWCGPCHTMDEWIWTDAEVAARLNAGYLGVKIDVDLEKPLVTRFGTSGYPTMLILNPDGSELRRVVEYQSSKMMLEFLRSAP